MAIATNRKQRLRKLEKEIRTGMEEFYYVGQKLKEIRDDELYREDGFETWERYCRERWELGKSRVHQLIVASEYRDKITTSTSGGSQWSERAVRELTRIPDKKQAARVAAKVVKEVERSEKHAANNGDSKPLKLTASTVRKFVDDDLGVDRAAKAKETKRERERSQLVDLHHYLPRSQAYIEGVTETLAQVPGDAWELLADSHPGVAERLAEACDELAALLRS